MLKKIRGKIENNPVYKFRQFWDSLNQGEQIRLWDILVALRGEDANPNGFDLKCATTARIRYELLGTRLSRLAKEVCCIFDQNDYMAGKLTPDEFEESSGHFKEHVTLAVLSLAKYVYKKRINDLYKVIGLDRS